MDRQTYTKTYKKMTVGKTNINTCKLPELNKQKCVKFKTK